MLPTISKITAFSAPYNNSYTEYQKYYQVSLKIFCQANDIEFSIQSNSFLPFLSAMLRIIRYSTKLAPIFRFLPVLRNVIDRIAKSLEFKKVDLDGQLNFAIGQYIVSYSDGSYKKICINSKDYGNIKEQGLLDWADVYFKTNYWPSIKYPDKVYPLPNGNPYIISHLNFLKKCRLEKKEYDLCFVVRVWGGSDEVSGVEHNLRLLEAVSEVKCRAFILALLVSGNVEDYQSRLDKKNIPYTTSPMKIQKLWEISSRASINVIRLGMHYCCPWRMADLFAMGACIAIDRKPFTLWPQPIEDGQHYLNLGIEVSPTVHVASQKSYKEATERLQKFILNKEHIKSIAVNNADYFDNHFSPKSIGNLICKEIN